MMTMSVWMWQRLRITYLDIQQFRPFYGWTSNGQIPYHKIGKRIYFIKSELDEWLSHGQHKSASDLQKEAEEYVARYRK